VKSSAGVANGNFVADPPGGIRPSRGCTVWRPKRYRPWPLTKANNQSVHGDGLGKVELVVMGGLPLLALHGPNRRHQTQRLGLRLTAGAIAFVRDDRKTVAAVGPVVEHGRGSGDVRSTSSRRLQTACSASRGDSRTDPASPASPYLASQHASLDAVCPRYLNRRCGSSTFQ